MSEEIIKIFYSYSRKDLDMRNTLEDHLAALRKANKIQTWHDLELEAGTEWEPAILNKLDTADIILLLVSHNFIASEYCFGTELKRAIARHDEGTARVIPIILRPCDWNQPYVPFSKLNVLPTHAEPITSWADQDAAFTIVAQRIRETVQSLTKALEEREVQKNSELEKVQLRGQQSLQTYNEDLSLDENQVDQISLEQILSSLELKDIDQELVSNSSKEITDFSPTRKEKPKDQTRNVSSRKKVSSSEEQDEAVEFANKVYTRKTRKSLSEIQEAIVRGAWDNHSYKDIANNCKSNPISLESVGKRLWDILTESLGENVNKSNLRAIVKRHLQKNRTPIVEDRDRKYINGIASTQICEYVNTLSGHSGWVNSIAVSSSRQIISGSQDETIKIWDLDTAKYLRDLGNRFFKGGHSNRVNSVAISPDSRVLASASEDGTVIVWNLGTYSKMYQLRHQGAVRCITISPDNQFLASGCSNHKIYIWNLVAGEESKKFIERDAIKALIFSPDGQTLIGATEDKIVKTWTIQNWSQQNLPIDSESSPDSLALNENGNLLAISYRDRKIKLIDLHRKEQLYSLSGQVVALSPDGEILATALDKEISLWKLETGELICPSVKAGNLVRSLAFSNDGLTLVSGQGEEIKIWRIRKDKLVHKL
ncbi:MAG: TIR domain-containing protein [Drouetiella hepatica Uher 2000/2452]|uniref:TIR domain-containing protein n=1 Tax=Drouetiella hepatica Uher 2000/2452 TaxID=904376 RepID=A0A951UN68_9CYAN|nr:TIR domain-containing protein [Drouetiella hepatica Uher 2000/2452]